MSQDLIRYDILAQEALRGVIRKVLGEVSRTGIPGNHHFFITFMTHATGVRISSRLREKYPEQMTIVIQHQYWDLEVHDTHFEVGLSFGDIPERLSIPFAAVRGFYDPSVNFELEFEVKLAEQAEASEVVSTPVTELETAKPKSAAKVKSETKKAAAAMAKTADAADQGDEPRPMADVVSLDSFRKNK
jgi:uncharacterized protein